MMMKSLLLEEVVVVVDDVESKMAMRMRITENFYSLLVHALLVVVADLRIERPYFFYVVL